MQGLRTELNSESPLETLDLSKKAAELPRLPDDVQRASQAGRLIIFLGAGLSCAAGLPSWEKVKEELITKVRLRPSEGEDLIQQFQSMDPYACFEAIYRRDRTIYEEVVDRSLRSEHANMILFNQLLDTLLSLQPISFVTTNFDDLLVDSKKFRKDQFRYTYHCAPQELREDKVFCLHGHREKNVFNSHDRDALYGNTHFRCFLNNLFGSYCVLFLGFSFTDRQLLDCAALNPDFSRDNHEFAGHFALLPSDHFDPPHYQLLILSGIRVFRYDNEDRTYRNFASSISSWRKVEAMGL
jgi:SIR2-like domain